MIKAIVAIGWLGMALLVGAAVLGYGVSDDETAQRHLVAALFAAAALLFVDLCLGVYLEGTRRLVRNLVREHALGGSWVADHTRLARRGVVPAALAIAGLVVTFAAGFPTHSGMLDPLVHHALAALAAAVQAIALVLGASALRRVEERLAALGREVEAVRYTAPSTPARRTAASPGSPSQETQ